MTVSQTIQMLAPYVEVAPVRGHLSGLFTVPRGGRHNKAKVKVHVRRGNEAIAYPMNDKAGGWRWNERRGYSEKDVVPAKYKEAMSIGADEIMGDQSFGMNPYENTSLMARAQEEIGDVSDQLNGKLARALELQAAQILQTGALTLVDDAGATVFSENFAPKAAHLFNASTTWATTGSAVPLTDIATAGDLIKQHSKRMPLRAHMNSVTFAQMLATDSVKLALNNDYRIDNGQIQRLDRGGQPVNPIVIGAGIYQGTLRCRNYMIDIYTYDEGYDHPQTGTYTKYIADYKVIVESGGRLDATFGQLNTFGSEQRGARMLGAARFGNPLELSDFTLVAWVSDDGMNFNVGIGTRAILFPVAIDSFCCITSSGF